MSGSGGTYYLASNPSHIYANTGTYNYTISLYDGTGTLLATDNTHTISVKDASSISNYLTNANVATRVEQRRACRCPAARSTPSSRWATSRPPGTINITTAPGVTTDVSYTSTFST